MCSDEYNILEKNVKELEKIFFDYDDEVCSDVDKQKYKAFVILFHSEIEDYLEKMVIRILNNLEEAIASAFIKKEKKFPDIDIIVEKIFERQRDAINKRNNGIKKDNISNMLRPVGIDFKEFDESNPEVISALSIISDQRGRFAHTSSVRVFDDYKSKKDFAEIIKTLRLLDKWLLEKFTIP